MKRLLITFFILLLAYFGNAQIVNGDRVNARLSFYLRGYRVDTLTNDTVNIQNAGKTVMTAGAVYRLLNSRLQGIAAGNVDSSIFSTLYRIDTAKVNIRNSIESKADTSIIWKKTGNGGIDTTLHFLGTTDLKPLIFRTNNVQAGYISAMNGIPAATNGTVVLGQYAGANLGSSEVHGNTLIGHAAGYNLRQSPLKSHQNTFIGLWAGYSTDTFSDPFGGRSVLVGQSTAFRNYDGSSLTYVGTFAGELNHRGNYNTGIGRDALRSNIDGNYNTSIGGLSALYGTTGIKTIAVVDSGSGYTSATVTISAPPVFGPGVYQQTATATASISGGKITGITVTNPGGGYSLSTMGLFHTTPITVTISGDGTGATATVTETQSATGNTSLGYAAGYLDKYGKYNISIGYLTTINSKFGENIVLIGTGANIGASSPSPILNSVAIGKNAKVSASNTIALGGTGADAAKVVIGAESTSVGFELVNSAGAAIDSITIDAKGLSSGQQTSLAIGIDAMRNATGANSTAIGYKSQELFGTSSNVAHNTSVGAFTLKKVNQFGNSAFGSNSSVDITTGYRNTGIGAYTNYKVVSGKSNTGVGFWSLNENLGDYNTGLGDGSGASITTGNYNTAIGAFSMGHSTLTFFPGTAKLTGSYNTGLGITSLFNLTSGSYNTGVGNIAGSAITSGSYNVIIGSNTGSTIATANRRIIISDGEGNSRQEIDSLGNVLFTGTGGVRLTIGTTAQRPTNAAGLIRWNTDSASFEYADGISWYKIGASSGGGSMIYPGAGIAVSTGSAWGTSITDNSSNWNTAYGWGNHAGLYPTVARFTDSLLAHTSRFDGITASLAAKLNISDTASMLTNYVRGSATSGQIALWNGTRNIYGHSHYTFSNNTSYPQLTIGSAGAVNSSIALRDAAGTFGYIGTDGGPVNIYGTSTYKRIQGWSYAGGKMFFDLYDNGTSKSMSLKKTIITVDTIVGGASDGSIMGIAYIGDSTSLGTGNSGHMYRAIATQGYNAASLNTFYSTLRMGNVNAGATQGHGVSFQHDFVKTGANTLDIMYGAAFLMDSIIAGTVNKRYGLRYWDAWVNGGARLGYQSALKFEKLKAAAVGLNAHILADSSDYAQLDGNMYLGDSLHASGARKAFHWFNGTAPTSSISGAIVWAEGGELKARDASGNVTTLTDPTAGGSADGYVASASFSTTTNVLTLTQIGAADVTVRIPPSYLQNPVHPDSLLRQVNDSTGMLKVIAVNFNGTDITPTRTDSLLRYSFNAVTSSVLLDSLANHTTRFNGVTSSLALKLNLSDSASMLSNYVRRQELKDTAAAIRSAIGVSSGSYTIGALDGGTPSGDGASISGTNAIHLQTFSSELAGLVPPGAAAGKELTHTGWQTKTIDINPLTADTITLNDYLPFYDATESVNKKVKLDDMLHAYYRQQRRTSTFDYYNEFINTASTSAAGNDVIAINSGTSAATSGLNTDATNRVGLVRSTTGTTATGRTFINSSAFALRFGGGKWVYEQYINIATLSTSTERYQALFGFFDTYTAANQVDGAYILYDEGGASTGSTASANWQLVTTSNSTRTFTTTSTAVAAATWTKLRVEVKAAGTQVDFFVNDVNVGTHTTNIPTATGRETGFGWGMIKSVGTTARTMDIDYLLVTSDYTTDK